MGNSFFIYLQQLELLVFFSGYPLLYATVMLLAGKNHSKTFFNLTLTSLLSFAYALTGSLYLGLQLRNLYPDYSLENIRGDIYQPLLFFWGLTSLIFWIPEFKNKRILSLVHSLVFFFFLAKNLFLYAIQSNNYRHDIRNAMKIYTFSLLLNLGSLLIVFLIALFLQKVKKQKR
jgi:hypothetical protein